MAQLLRFHPHFRVIYNSIPLRNSQCPFPPTAEFFHAVALKENILQVARGLLMEFWLLGNRGRQLESARFCLQVGRALAGKAAAEGVRGRS